MKRVLLSAAVIGAGCGRGGREEPAPGPSIAPEVPVVRLLEPGVEPRQTLAYRFEPGRLDKIRISIISSDTVQSSGREPRTFPANVLSFDLAVSATPSGQAAAVEATLTAVDSTDEERADKHRMDGASLLGGAYRFSLGVRGPDSEIEWRGPPVAGGSDLLKEDLKSKLPVLFARLPAEPVGIGARWELAIERDKMGAHSREIYRYRLDEVTSAALEISLEVENSVSGSVTASSLARGALRVAHPVWRPALATLERRGDLSFTDRQDTVTVRQTGGLEITLPGERPVPIRTTCAELERCCAAVTSQVAPNQAEECRAAVRGGDRAACSVQRTNLVRAFMILGVETPDGCSQMR